MVVFSAALLAAVAPAPAAPAASGTLAGVVVRSDGGPVDGAAVALEGPLRAAQTTDAAGRFRFVGLPAGRYALLASKAGFAAARLEDLRLARDVVLTTSVALAPSSFSSLREIGRIATGQPARAAINTSAAAVSVIAPQALLDQGRLQVTELLNQTPGIITTTHADEGANGASRGAPQATQIRGALPYETELAHRRAPGLGRRRRDVLAAARQAGPAAGRRGRQGPGRDGGRAQRGDRRQRQLPHARADPGARGEHSTSAPTASAGSTGRSARPARRAGWATRFAATADGTRGGLNQDVAGSGLPLLYAAPPYTIDGRPVAGSPLQLGASNATPQYEGFPGIGRYREPLYVCCSPVASGYDSHAALVKLRYGFSPQTALTVSVLDGESRTDAGGARAQNLTPGLDYSTFAPPAGYGGSVAAGTPISFDGVANVGLHQTDRQRLVQGELRSALGATTVLARYYAGIGSSYLFNGAGSAAFGFSERAWGGIPLCPAGSAFTGTACALPGGASTAPDADVLRRPARDVSRGERRHVGADLGLRARLLARARPPGRRGGADAGGGPLAARLAPVRRLAHDPDPGLLARARLRAARDDGARAGPVRAHAAARRDAQRSRHRVRQPLQRRRRRDVGDATRTLQAPRLGVAWRPFPDLAWRLGAGASVAPPYINLLSSLGSQPIANTNGSATGYLQNANGGQVRPETAFGYDLGLDRRFGYLTFSGDVYLTNLRDLFLTQTVQNGSYTPPTGPNAGNTEPLYVTQTENLARARFEGVELSVRRAPPTGFGFLAQGSLQRAYPYALPPDFHATAAGPLTANLAVLPGVNFQPSGPGYNGLSYGRVPYAQGYGEVSARTGGGALYRLGLTYYGATTPTTGRRSGSSRRRCACRCRARPGCSSPATTSPARTTSRITTRSAACRSRWWTGNSARSTAATSGRRRSG